MTGEKSAAPIQSLSAGGDKLKAALRPVAGRDRGQERWRGSCSAPRVQVRVQMLNQWLHAEISAFGLGGEEEAEEGKKNLDF